MSTTDSDTSQDLKPSSYGTNNLNGFDKKERINQNTKRKSDQLNGGGLFADEDIESVKLNEPYQPSPKTISVCFFDFIHT